MLGLNNQIVTLIAIPLISEITSLPHILPIGIIAIILYIIASEIKPDNLVAIANAENVFYERDKRGKCSAYTQGIINPIIILSEEMFRSNYFESKNAIIEHERGHILTKAGVITIAFYFAAYITLCYLSFYHNIRCVVFSSGVVVIINFILHVILEIVADRHCSESGYHVEIKGLIKNDFVKSATNILRSRFLEI